MEEFYPFFLIIFFGVLFSMLSIRTHIPWAVMLIIGGIFVGPDVLSIADTNETIEFMGQIGLVFLMFMAGLETKLSYFRAFRSQLVTLTLINGLVPFAVGLGVTLLIGYSFQTALLIGILFISSSVAVVVPSLERFEILQTKIGKSVIATTVLQDIGSLLLLSLLLQSVSPVTEVPLYVFYPVLIGVLVMLRLIIPRIKKYLERISKGSPGLFQLEFRSTFLLLIGTVITFELLGLHPIVAGFFSGLVLSDSMRSQALRTKIRTISYGIFIPIFFIVVGLKTDLSVLANSDTVMVVIITIIASLVISKYASGWYGARLVGFEPNEAGLFAATSLPQLSTTLAAAFAAFNLGLLDQVLLTSLVLLSIVTVLISPMLINRYAKALER